MIPDWEIGFLLLNISLPSRFNVTSSNSHTPHSNHSVPLIGIAGGSGSGKTTLARQFVQAAPWKVTYIELDSYYRDLSHIPHRERGQTNFDHPEALEIPLLCQHLSQMAKGESVKCPLYDFHTHTRIGTNEIEPKSLILLEGMHVLGIPDLRRLLNIGFYIDIPDDIRLLRRIRRDLNERGRSLDFIEMQYRTFVRPMHEQFISPSKNWADTVLDGLQSVDVLVREMVGRIEGMMEQMGSA